MLLAVLCPSQYSIHYLRQGELLFTVAANCSVDLGILTAANPQITNINNVSGGEPVCVPAACCDGRVQCSSSGSAPAPSPSTGSANAGKLVVLLRINSACVHGQ